MRELLLTEECQGDWSDCKGNVVHCIWTMNDPVRRWALSKSSQQGISLLLYSSADSSCQSLYTPQIFMTLPTVGRVFVYSDDFELFYHSISIHHTVDNVEILSPCWQKWIMPSSWWRIGDMTAMGFLHYVFCFFFFFFRTWIRHSSHLWRWLWAVEYLHWHCCYSSSSMSLSGGKMNHLVGWG